MSNYDPKDYDYELSEKFSFYANRLTQREMRNQQILDYHLNFSQPKAKSLKAKKFDERVKNFTFFLFGMAIAYASCILLALL